MTDILVPPGGQFLREGIVRGGMDLLFFANTRHLKRADLALARLGLGRAHHRVLYFVARRPGQRVSELLVTLDVTKQSAARVLTTLINKGFVELRVGERDWRQRLLYLTPAGLALERELFTEMRSNVARAYSAAGSEAVAGFWIVMQNLIGAEGREQFRAIQANADDGRRGKHPTGSS